MNTLHVLLILYMIASMVLVVWFARLRHRFPIKGRAPLLNILHAIYFFGILAIPLSAEFLVSFHLNVWVNLDHMPELRKVLKALYMACRAQSILAYSSRSFYVYFAWKYGKQSTGSVFKQIVTNDFYLCIGNVALFWVLTLVCYVLADFYMTSVPLFDYNLIADSVFINEAAFSYYWNFTWQHICELILLLMCCYANR